MTYTVSESARKSGIGAHTLRFYDRQGLLPFVERDSNGIRKFKEEDFEWLQIIKNLKATGVSIKKIKEYIDLCFIGDAALEQRLKFVQEHKIKITRQMKELEDFMKFIDWKIWYYNTAIEAGTESVHYQSDVVEYGVIPEKT